MPASRASRAACTRLPTSSRVWSYSSYQGVYHEGEYGVAVLSNTFTLPVETAYPIAEGIIDIVEGTAPKDSAAVNAISDYVLAALTVLTAALGIRRLVQSPGWAQRLSGRSALRLAARLSPGCIPSRFSAGLPRWWPRTERTRVTSGYGSSGPLWGCGPLSRSCSTWRQSLRASSSFGGAGRSEQHCLTNRSTRQGCPQRRHTPPGSPWYGRSRSAAVAVPLRRMCRLRRKRSPGEPVRLPEGRPYRQDRPRSTFGPGHRRRTGRARAAHRPPWPLRCVCRLIESARSDRWGCGQALAHRTRS